MSRVVSFGNIVNSLRAVRNDYNEHLKRLPQYEAFLLVESSTQKVADTLRDVAPEMAADVVETLERAKAKFRQHLTSVAEYRALLAIDKLISDVAADLGAQPATSTTVEAQPASANLESTYESAQVEHAAPAQEAVAQTEIAKPIQVPAEMVAQAEVAEQAPTSVEAAVQAQAGADAELISAEAISQIQTTLPAEGSAQPAQTGLAEKAASTPTELAAPTPTPETQWVTPLLPTTVGHEEEKAA
jgi:hypothetical protein